MSLFFSALVLFLLGLFHDVLWTVYLVAVQRHNAKTASLVSGLLTVFGFVAILVITKNTLAESAVGIAFYALGGCFGTFITLKKYGVVI